MVASGILSCHCAFKSLPIFPLLPSSEQLLWCRGIQSRLEINTSKMRCKSHNSFGSVRNVALIPPARANLQQHYSDIQYNGSNKVVRMNTLLCVGREGNQWSHKDNSRSLNRLPKFAKTHTKEPMHPERRGVEAGKRELEGGRKSAGWGQSWEEEEEEGGSFALFVLQLHSTSETILAQSLDLHTE